MSQRKQIVRVLVAKVGLDGHDRGAKVVAQALKDAGMEVVYTGLRNTPEDVVQAALQEDVHILGLSILSGAHVSLVRKVAERLRALGAGKDVALVIGGTIPPQDIPRLREMGAAAVFPMGTPIASMVQEMRTLGRQVLAAREGAGASA